MVVIMNDAYIKKKVSDQIIFDSRIKSRNIIVFVENGIVILSGRVRTYIERDLVEKVARNTQGVQAVVEELTIDLRSSLIRSDIEIAEAVLNALSWDAFIIPTRKINVTVENGDVILTGEVEEYYQKERATKCIRFLYGIRNIINLIDLKPNKIAITSEDISRKIMSSFQRNVFSDTNNLYAGVDLTKNKSQ